jgi:DNA-binding response OmpR family regulator
MNLSRYRRRDTSPGFIRLREARPVTDHATPKKVLLVEARAEMRELLSGLLQRQGLEVTEQSPEETDLQRRCPYDAVIFNADQKRLQRKRWLFGYKPPKHRTRLVALHDGDSDSDGDGEAPEFGCNEVDATLPYPVSMSELINAVLGS